MQNELPHFEQIRLREEFQSRNTVRRKTIYLMVIFFLLLIMALLPVIRIPLSVRGRGIIRPVQEKTEIHCPMTTQLVSSFIKEGQFVNKGDTLLILDPDFQSSGHALHGSHTVSSGMNNLFCMLAPVSGTIGECTAIHPGSLLPAGQILAVISPASEKIAEIYVSGKDIGYVRAMQKVNIQVDAFNYNEWGSIPGKVLSISDDYVLVDHQPVYRVKCSLKQEHLELKNGVRGKIRKGMTVSACFPITKRSLFQLLYQSADEVLNPSR